MMLLLFRSSGRTLLEPLFLGVNRSVTEYDSTLIWSLVSKVKTEKKRKEKKDMFKNITPVDGSTVGSLP